MPTKGGGYESPREMEGMERFQAADLNTLHFRKIVEIALAKGKTFLCLVKQWLSKWGGGPAPTAADTAA